MAERSVLITGGSGGLGEGVVAAFVADGWRVVAPVRPGSTARLPDGVIRVEADVTSAVDVGAAVAVAGAEAAAPLRAVVNLVGGYASAGLVHETPVDEFEAMLRVNLRPTYLVTSAA
ncbi:MAG TPA: SDR family NAD(P)-dependent oxidoreductase, partial [Actinoplanes sp.]|nr:SDR family NAD(P)-dependent oxidoreductase [Actinoplanes sp.]